MSNPAKFQCKKSLPTSACFETGCATVYTQKIRFSRPSPAPSTACHFKPKPYQTWKNQEVISAL
jgi:hypothetical protein